MFRLLPYSVFSFGFLIFICACHESSIKEKAVSTEVPAAQAVEIEKGKVYNRVTSNGSYSLYIPKTFSGKEKYPVIIFLDPHADGSYPLTKYMHLAEKFGFMLLGSNESKNGISFDQSKDISAHLRDEAINVLPGSERMVRLAGFSGGAKAALLSGCTLDGIQGIIYCGAAFPPKNLVINKPLIGFAGRKDMNYTEVKSFNYSLNGSLTPHSLVEWNGKHEWPDSATFSHAFFWSSLNGMKIDQSLLNKKLIVEYRDFINQSIGKTDILNKVLLLKEAIYVLDTLAPINEYFNELKSIEKSAAYISAKRNLETTIFFEDKQKEMYANAFESKDLLWWKKQIDQLHVEKNNLINQRILGYISLAAWTYSSKAVEANNFQFALKALDIYKQADPENSEQPFLKARLYAKNNDSDSAIYFLKEAVGLGLKDRAKIENEQDLNTIRGRSDFADLLVR